MEHNAGFGGDKLVPGKELGKIGDGQIFAHKWNQD
jgi:hypothetical protein